MTESFNTYSEFKDELIVWAEGHNDIEGLGVVGSYARGEQREESDIDVMVFCANPDNFVSDHAWLGLFGKTKEVAVEDWGGVQTVRAGFESGMEIEFNFGRLAWADVPVDPGTTEVVTNGFDVLYDPNGRLTNLRNHVLGG